ncbi:MAG: dihydroorotase [Clostridia bacterium]|nr:dihydroorotase [Clostridia bacterium]
MSILIKNARIVDPKNDFDFVGDIFVGDGKIKKIAEEINCSADEVIDANGLVACAGLVDMHVHLRDPGVTHKEDIITGCNAAVAGGVTSMAAMPNTKPVTDNVETVRYIIEKSEGASARVYPVASVTRGMAGEAICDFTSLSQAGAVAFSDDGVPVATRELLREGIAETNKINKKILAHCEELSLVRGGIINLGEVSEKLGVKGITPDAEDVGTLREIEEAEKLAAPIHICHVSTKGSVEIIRQAKVRGVKVTAETAPHYFWFTEEKLLSRDADYRMNPPLRCEEDRLAIIDGILDGTLDAIATDHAPHTVEDKSDFEKAPNGVVGMETSFSASYTALVKTGLISLKRLLALMSFNPAQILGISAGVLAEGENADLFLFDENEKWTVDVNKLHGKSVNCVFKDVELLGKVKYTVCRGKIVYKDN